jgi:stringent starvation protein B
MADISTKPYLLRAIHEWCEDSGYRPYIAVIVDERTQVPQEFVRNGEIVLNVSAQATHRLRIGNDFVEFEARFSGAVRSVSIPIENVSAIYAQETGHGMAFDVIRATPSRPSAPPAARAPSDAPRSAPSRRSSPADQVKTEPATEAPARPRLVPKVAPTPAADAIEAKPTQAGRKADSGEGSPRVETPTPRKTRSPRRRASPADKPAVADDESTPVSAEVRAAEGPKTDTPAAEPPGPRSEPPAGPPQPARGHLKRVK